MRFLFLNASVIAVAMFTSSFNLQPAAADHVDFIRNDSTGGGMDATFGLSSSSNTTATTTTVTGANADILGTTRGVSLQRTGSFGGTVTANKLINTLFIDFAATNTATGNLLLDYNGIENANFSSAWDGFLIDLPSLSNALASGGNQLTVSVGVESTAGNGTSVAQTLMNQNSALVAVDFTDPGFVGVDFSDVDRVTINFSTGIIGSRFQVGSIIRRDIAAVPEPSTIAFIGSSVILGLLRRRRD